MARVYDLRTNWKPILKGSLERRAWRYIEKVDKELRVFEKNFLKGPHRKTWQSNGMASSLFYHYLHKVTGEKEHEKRAESFYNQSVEAMDRLPIIDRLYSGFTGLSWLAEHFDSDDSGEENGTDAYLASKTRRGCKPKTPLGMYSVVDDWVGYGIYALERWPNGQSETILKNIVTLLDRKARRTEDGVTWYTSKSALYQSHHYRCGHFNVGLAHGVPGVIGFLSYLLKTNIQRDVTLDLLKNSVRWLLAQDDGKHFGYFFPSNSARGPEGIPRLAWCYGDLGVSITLFNAAKALKDSKLEKKALDIARRAARFSRSESLVQDPHLCHGASGVFHIYNQFYQKTGDKEFLETAVKWSRETLDMVERPLKFSKPIYDFLDGKPGTALALLGGISKVPPNWDRILLVSSL